MRPHGLRGFVESLPPEQSTSTPPTRPASSMWTFTTTGRPRRIGWLDLVQLRWAIRAHGITKLAITKLDTLAKIHPLKVCTAYKLKGKTIANWPYSRSEIFDMEPVYETFPGFSGDISKAKRFSDLPKGARDFVLWIEKQLGVPVTIVSVGPSRDATILRDKPAW